MAKADAQRGAIATRTPAPVNVASPFVYEDERVLWAAEQPIGRRMPVRFLAAIPGLLVVAAAIATANELVEHDPLALTGARGVAVPGALAAVAAAGAGWSWGVMYRPVSAYLGVVKVHAVLTTYRLLWVETLEDGTTRVRHPFRPAMIRPGDLAGLAPRGRDGGPGEIALIGHAGASLGTLRVEPGPETVRDVAALLGRALRITGRPPLARRGAERPEARLPGKGAAS